MKTTLALFVLLSLTLVGIAHATTSGCLLLLTVDCCSSVSVPKTRDCGGGSAPCSDSVIKNDTLRYASNAPPQQFGTTDVVPAGFAECVYYPAICNYEANPPYCYVSTSKFTQVQPDVAAGGTVCSGS